MSKYYVYDNATRKIRVGNHSFAFDVVGNIAGAWRGVMKLDDPEAIKSLEIVSSKLGIREISFEEYDEFLKKKANYSGASGSITPVSQPQTNLSARGAGVVLVEGQLKRFGNPPVEATTTPTKIVSEEPILLGTAKYNDPLDVKLNEKAPKKKKSS
jgi:hypothetical protein